MVLIESDASIKKKTIQLNHSSRKLIKFTDGIPIIAICIDESYAHSATSYGVDLLPSYCYIINDNRGVYYIDEVMLWESKSGNCSLIIVYYI